MTGAIRVLAECVVIGLAYVMIILSPGILLAQDAAKPKESPTPAANEAVELARKLANPKQIIHLAVGPQFPISGTPLADFGWRPQLTLIFPK
jgi:hypothetical protein